MRRGTDFRSVQNARDVSLMMHTVQTQELIPTSPPTVAMMQQILSQKSSPNKTKLSSNDLQTCPIWRNMTNTPVTMSAG